MYKHAHIQTIITRACFLPPHRLQRARRASKNRSMVSLLHKITRNHAHNHTRTHDHNHTQMLSTSTSTAAGAPGSNNRSIVSLLHKITRNHENNHTRTQERNHVHTCYLPPHRLQRARQAGKNRSMVSLSHRVGAIDARCSARRWL